MTANRKDIDAMIALLCEQFPRAFFQFQDRRRPLKIGVHRDILDRLGDVIDAQELRAAMRFYTGNVGYRRCQTAGADRIDLDGTVAGSVTAEEAANAAKSLAALRARRKPGKAIKTKVAAGMPAKVATPAPEVTAKPEREPPRSAEQPAPPRRLGLADLKTAAQRRKEFAR
jgi:ProP effector